MADRTDGDHWMGGNGERLTRFLREEWEDERISGLFFEGGGMVGGDQNISGPMKLSLLYRFSQMFRLRHAQQ